MSRTHEAWPPRRKPQTVLGQWLQLLGAGKVRKRDEEYILRS